MNFIEEIIDLKNYFNFDCSMTCENKKMFQNRISNLIIKHLNKLIFVRGINNLMYNINEYIVIFCFMKKKLLNDLNHLIKFIMKIYLIDINIIKS